MTFGEKLYQLRKRQGLSQEALAEKLNTSRQAISKSFILMSLKYEVYRYNTEYCSYNGYDSYKQLYHVFLYRYLLVLFHIAS